MNDVALYVALVDKSIAYNREHGLDIKTCDENVFDKAALKILQNLIGTGMVGEFLDEADRLREVQRKEQN